MNPDIAATRPAPSATAAADSTSSGVHSDAAIAHQRANVAAGTPIAPEVTYNGSLVPGRNRLTTIAPAALRLSQFAMSADVSTSRLRRQPEGRLTRAPRRPATHN